MAYIIYDKDTFKYIRSSFNSYKGYFADNVNEAKVYATLKGIKAVVDWHNKLNNHNWGIKEVSIKVVSTYT